MRITDISEAKASLSKLVPYEADRRPRDMDRAIWRDRVWIAEDFDELPADVMAAFVGEDADEPPA